MKLVSFSLLLLALFLHTRDTAGKRPANDCPYSSRVERTLSALTASLFEGDYLPPGDVLDVGANDGKWACMYAWYVP